MFILTAVYAVVGLGFACLLGLTLKNHPLFPVQSDSAEWSSAWLLTTVCDYYVLGLCISTIIWVSESSMGIALLWIFLINVLGSPWFCLYLILRIRAGKGIALATGEGDDVYERL